LKHEQFDGSPEGKLILNEWAEALEGFFAHIPLAKWMNHPSCNVAASHKIEQLTRAPSLGFLVPDTLITQDAKNLRGFCARQNGRVIVKPMAGGRVERPEGQTDMLIYTNRVSPDQLDNLDDLPSCPTLFQQDIEKKCDVRITVVGQDVYAVELTAKEPGGSQRCDIRRNNMDDVTYKAITLPQNVVASLKRLMRHYNLRFATIDMAIGTDARWYFFEVNPNGQWAWLDLAGVTKIASSFVREFGA
jgi:glutathione synthase/RimK-type ligase-like ATP-grasp enzyme